MKQSLLSLSLILGLSITATQAQAAIMYQVYNCGATHTVDSPNPVPGAPHYGLRCYVAVGGISGKGINCSLISKPIYPNAEKTEVPLKTLSYEDHQGVLETDGIQVQVNTQRGSAKIEIGSDMLANCQYNELIL